MSTEPPDLSISRVFDAPRAVVYRAFIEPEQVAAWWGPTGSVRPLDEMEFDVRPGGHQRFVALFPDDPSIRAEVHIDLADVAEARVLDGVMRVRGRIPEGFETFETRFRFEFHDEPDGRTRLEVRQWLPPHVTGATEAGWGQSFAQLDTHLATVSPSPT
ncbi:SRPBCC family protein [Dermatobacter hominis]|uniref:SRPBCC family protein n=1 Tax=Dermatobacter hominis TaxID=2884263 RepID=UPI001D107AF9|nr:SRPBCC domain-containing protein [Dermatobacter hominis]UDY35861.1 SRPBCC domain-containing protein [Dermatobacter hominis]